MMRSAPLGSYFLLALIGVSQLIQPVPLFAQASGLSSIQTKFTTAQTLQKEARDELSGILKADPSNRDALFLSAEIDRRQERWEDAASQYEKLLAIDPEHALARLRVGQCYLKDWATSEAIQSLKGSLEIQTRRPDAAFPLAENHVWLGDAFAQNEDFDLAVEEYRAALRIDPSLTKTRYALARQLFNSGNKPAAREEFSAILKEDPQFPMAHYYLGVIADGNKDPAAALAEFQAELKNDPLNSLTHTWLASIYDKTGNTAAAKAEYEELVKLSPRNDNGHLNLGRIFLKEKNYPRAIVEFKAIEPTRYNQHVMKQARKLLITAYNESGDRDRAQALLFSEPYLGYKALAIVMSFLLPIALTFLHGMILVRKIDPLEGEKRTRQFHSLRQWTTRYQILGNAIIAAGAFSLQDLFENSGVSLWPVLIAVLILAGLATRVVFFMFDRKLRKTGAGLREYFFVYLKALFMMCSFYLVIFGIYFWFSQVPPTAANHVAIALVLLFAIYGYQAFTPWQIKFLNRIIPWPGGVKEQLQAWADKLKVPCRDILLIKSDQFRTANALATGIGPKTFHVFVFSYAVDLLDRAELEAIFLHELAHLKFGHVRIRLHLAAAFLLGNLALMSLGQHVSLKWGWPYLANILLYLFANRILSKRQERQADEFVAENFSDPQALIRALEKLYASNYIPAKWKSPLHPSLNHRMAYLKAKITKSPAQGYAQNPA